MRAFRIRLYRIEWQPANNNFICDEIPTALSIAHNNLLPLRNSDHFEYSSAFMILADTLRYDLFHAIDLFFEDFGNNVSKAFRCWSKDYDVSN